MALTNFVERVTKITAVWLNKVDKLMDSVLAASGYGYLPTFGAGYVAYIGPDGTLQFNTSLIFGTLIPNSSGVPGVALLIGGGVPNAYILTDTVAPGVAGINLVLQAGDTDSSGVVGGGTYWTLGGGSYGGAGGTNRMQGGTSFNGDGGGVEIIGGNSTNNLGKRGPVYIQGGENGTDDGIIHLIMAYNSHGTKPAIRHRANSTILWEESYEGAWFFKALGAGEVGDTLVSQGTADTPQWKRKDYSAYKLASTNRASQSSVTDDPDLQISIVSPGTYALDLYLAFYASSVGTQGIQFKLNYTGTIGNLFYVYDGFVNGITYTKDTQALNASHTAQFATITTVSTGEWIRYKGFLRVTDQGLFTLQWSQRSSNAAATVLLIGSHMRLNRMD